MKKLKINKSKIFEKFKEKYPTEKMTQKNIGKFFNISETYMVSIFSKNYKIFRTPLSKILDDLDLSLLDVLEEDSNSNRKKSKRVVFNIKGPTSSELIKFYLKNKYNVTLIINPDFKIKEVLNINEKTRNLRIIYENNLNQSLRNLKEKKQVEYLFIESPDSIYDFQLLNQFEILDKEMQIQKTIYFNFNSNSMISKKKFFENFNSPNIKGYQNYLINDCNKIIGIYINFLKKDEYDDAKDIIEILKGVYKINIRNIKEALNPSEK